MWAHGMAIHAQIVAAIAAGLTAVAAHGAATAQVNGELAAADEEARLTQEAIACKEAEVRALEEARFPREGKEGVGGKGHAEATAKAQADTAKKDAIEAARHRRRNGGGRGQTPPRDSPGRITSGDPSKAFRRGRLLQDDAGRGRHGQRWEQWPHRLPTEEG